MSLATHSPPQPPSAPWARPVRDPDASPAPLTEAHYRALHRAASAWRAVRKAAGVAQLSAASILVVGALGVPLALLFPSLLGFLTAGGVATVGVVEYVGARRLRRGQQSAVVLLAGNQLAFMTLIVVYCLVQLLSSTGGQTHDMLLSGQMQDSLSQLGMQQGLGQELQHWTAVATYGLYGSVIVLSVIFQGGLAYYYFSRRPHLQSYRQNTPPWIQRLFAELEL